MLAGIKTKPENVFFSLVLHFVCFSLWKDVLYRISSDLFMAWLFPDVERERVNLYPHRDCRGSIQGHHLPTVKPCIQTADQGEI